MTWVRVTDGAPVRVQAHKVDYNGSPQIQLAINGEAAYLSEEDAASLGGYLLGTTNNEPAPEAAPTKKGALPTNHWAQTTPDPKEVEA